MGQSGFYSDFDFLHSQNHLWTSTNLGNPNFLWQPDVLSGPNFLGGSSILGNPDFLWQGSFLNGADFLSGTNFLGTPGSLDQPDFFAGPSFLNGTDFLRGPDVLGGPDVLDTGSMYKSLYGGGIGDENYQIGLPEIPGSFDDSRLGAKVWQYNTVTGGVVDLTDGIGDLGRGFGNPSNRYPWSMESHNGDLYVGVLTGNPIQDNLLPQLFHDADQYPTLYSTGPEVWRWNVDLDAYDGGTWEQVLAGDNMDVDLEGQVGVRELFSYDAYLYATTSNNLAPTLLQESQIPATMLRSMDGETWEEVTGGPFDNPNNNSVRTMVEYDGLLYVGTETDQALLDGLGGGGGGPSPELWTFNGTDWNQLGNGSMVDGFAISEILEFDDTIYFGTWNIGGYNLYKVDDSMGHFEEVTPITLEYVGGPTLPDYVMGATDVTDPLTAGNFGEVNPFDDFGIIKMFEFDNHLYFGTVDYLDGTTFMRSDTPSDVHSWELITTDGFLSEYGAAAVNVPNSGVQPLQNGNFYIWSSAVVSNDIDHLFIGTFNGLDGAGQVLKSDDGINFDFVTQDAFGATNTYGIRSMEPMDEFIYIGGASPITEVDPNSDPYPLTPMFLTDPFSDFLMM